MTLAGDQFDPRDLKLRAKVRLYNKLVDEYIHNACIVGTGYREDHEPRRAHAARRCKDRLAVLAQPRRLALGLRRRELEEVGRKLDSLIEAIADGFRAPGLQAKLDELEHRRVRLAGEIDAAPTTAPRLHPNLA